MLQADNDSPVYRHFGAVLHRAPKSRYTPSDSGRALSAAQADYECRLASGPHDAPKPIPQVGVEAVASMKVSRSNARVRSFDTWSDQYHCDCVPYASFLQPLHRTPRLRPVLGRRINLQTCRRTASSESLRHPAYPMP